MSSVPGCALRGADIPQELRALCVGTLLACARRMAKRKRDRLGAVLTGAGLTVALGTVATLLANLVSSPAAMLALSALAFIGAGVSTLRLRPSAQPLEAAIGAGSAVLLFSAVQIGMSSELRDRVGWGQIATSLAVSTALALGLAWFGGVIGATQRARSRARAPSSRSRRAPVAAASEPIAAGPPESGPAHHSS